MSPEQAPAPPAKPPAKLFACVWVVIALILAELGARALDTPPAPAFAAHPYVRRVRVPAASQTYLDPWTREKFQLHVDDYGFRSRSLEPRGQPKTPGSYRVFFVGASTTENIVLPDEKTFPALVEAELGRRLGGTPRVVCVNTALSGNMIVDSLSLVAHRIQALEPDLIVYMDAANTLRGAFSARFDPTHTDDLVLPEPPRLKEVLRRLCRLYDLAVRAGDHLEGDDRAARYRKRRLKTPFTQGLDPGVGIPYFLRYLGMIDAICRERGVPLAIMTQPSLYKEEMTPAEDAVLYLGCLDHGGINVDTPTMLRGMRAYNAATRTFAAERGRLLIELEGRVPADLEHFYDDFHYTAKGNEAVAAAIVEALLASGRLPGPPGEPAPGPR